ncbi:hypothetical protein E2C01_068702 [Portunus trituberculatus]|uniref:Uncharacterized protein n=1 Tax=Portunus trituberculatus TaxID=210409 RepID=A0A5B7I0T3_PORTR|nr:hypothetical protein [Portunus trituberculatus]
MGGLGMRCDTFAVSQPSFQASLVGTSQQCHAHLFFMTISCLAWLWFDVQQVADDVHVGRQPDF